MYVCCMLRLRQCFIPRMTCKAPHKHMPLAWVYLRRRESNYRGSDMHRLYRTAGHPWHSGTMICGNLFLRFIILLQLHIIHPLIGLGGKNLAIYIYTSSHLFKIYSMFLNLFCPAAIISAIQNHHLRCLIICMKSRTARPITGPVND